MSKQVVCRDGRRVRATRASSGEPGRAKAAHGAAGAAPEEAIGAPDPAMRLLTRGGLETSTSRARRDWLPYVVVITALAAVCAFIPVERARWLVPVGGVVALGALVHAVGRHRGQGPRGALARHPFVLLSAGLALTVVSEVLSAVGGSSAGFAQPTALSAYPFLIAGLVALNGTRVREHAVDTVLVAAIAPSALFAFGWLPLVEAVERWAGTSGETSWAAWSMLGVDALAVAIIARLALLFRGRPVAYQMLLAAMACMLGAHIARAVGVTIGLAPAPFGAQAMLLISFALMAGASLHPSMRPASAAKTRADSIGRPHLMLLVLVILVGPVFALARYGERGTWVLLVAAGPAAVSLLVVAHLSRLIRERQRLEYMSTHDALTGLPNRTAFHDRLALLLGRITGTDGPGVMFLDLDRFKHVNDTFGHDAGDELLREVALRLRQCVRADDTVARLAGDEFALLFAAPCGAARAEDIARRILTSFAEPFHVAGVALSVSPSMGVALAPEHGAEADALLRNADSAMYAAKAGGRNTFRSFQPGMASAAERHLLLEKRFRQAIADGELLVHYQPRVDTVTRRLVGVEALVRWQHPSLGVIPPGAFISMAESTGAIAELGKHVLEQACADAAAWGRAGLPVAVSVNVSPRQFALQDVPGVVATAIARSGLPAGCLELELTESLHLSDDGSVTQALQRISELGVTCAVDDFGTGYSSIAVLRDYPIGVVKLDQSFVQPAGGSVDAPLVRGVVQLAQGLGMRVVAEGVETQAQMEFLAGILCDEVQGFLVSRAVPASHILTVIRDGGGDPSLVPSLSPVILDVNERRLVELLWAEEEELGRLQDDEPHEMRFAAVLGTAATVMAVPIVLGIGAGGGLPPAMQTTLASSLDAIGAEPPRFHGGVPPTSRALAAGVPTTAGWQESTARSVHIPAPRSSDDARTPVQRDHPAMDTGRPVGPPAPAREPAPLPPARDRGEPQTSPEDKGQSRPGTAPGSGGGTRAEAPGKGAGRPTAGPGRGAGTPVAVPGTPAAAPGRGTGKPVAIPGKGAGKPVAAPGKPVTAPGKPVAAPGKGAGRPVAAPGRPVAAPGRPVAAPGRPVAAPGRPVAAPGRPVAAPGGAGKPATGPGKDAGTGTARTAPTAPGKGAGAGGQAPTDRGGQADLAPGPGGSTPVATPGKGSGQAAGAGPSDVALDNAGGHATGLPVAGPKGGKSAGDPGPAPLEVTSPSSP